MYLRELQVVLPALRTEYHTHRISIHSTFLRSLSQHKKSRCSKIQGLRVLHRYGGSACWVSRRGAPSLRVLSHRKEWQLSEIRIIRHLLVRLLALCLVCF